MQEMTVRMPLFVETEYPWGTVLPGAMMWDEQTPNIPVSTNPSDTAFVENYRIQCIKIERENTNELWATLKGEFWEDFNPEDWELSIYVTDRSETYDEETNYREIQQGWIRFIYFSPRAKGAVIE